LSNDEICAGVSWCLARTARYPADTAAVAQSFGLGNRPISKIRVSSLDRTRDAIDLAAASVDVSLGIVEHAIFGKSQFHNESQQGVSGIAGEQVGCCGASAG
jgi:hypothetical protein